MDEERQPEQKQNNFDLIDNLQKILDRSDTEVDRVYKIYRTLAAAVTLILAVGIATFGYVNYNSVKDMRNDLREESKTIREKAAQEMSEFKQKTSEESKLLKDQMKSEQEMIVANVGKRVNQRIEDEFNKDNIQNLVSAKATDRIDKVADQLIGKQIEKKIDPKIKAAEEKINKVDEQVATTDKSIKDLKAQTDFATVVADAQNHNRSAFDQLMVWSEDISFPLHEKATQASKKIMEDHEPAFGRSPIDFPWRKEIDPSKLTLQELRNAYDAGGDYKASIIKYVWKQRTDIPKKERMQFLIDVINSEKDLVVLGYAGTCFKEESKQNVYVIAYWQFLKWWGEHKDEIK